MQTTSHLLMIRPVSFGFNPETAVNNAFQVDNKDQSVQQKALEEFDGLVAMLRENGVDITVVEDIPEPHTPDAVFPNNWISFHENGLVVLYPMFAANRRLERKQGVLNKIDSRFRVRQTIDLTENEKEDAYLEGTGSMVLDRQNKIAYACISPRTDYFVLTDFCATMDYTAVTFDAFDKKGQAIYHTNVMMCVADKYAVICLDAIVAAHEKEEVRTSLEKSGKTIIAISPEQMNHFAGNMLQVSNGKNEMLLVMSSQAFNALSQEQVQQLSSYNKIIHAPLTTIETNGGGSARCMMAEIFLPVR